MGQYLFLVLGGIVAIQLACFALAAWYKTDKLTDLAYGSTFALVTVVCYFFVSEQTRPQAILTLCVMLRGVRLSGYLFVRVLVMGHDKRFDTIRENVWSFFKFWILQAVTIRIVLLPVLVALYQTTSLQVTILSGVGVLLWLVGWLIESVADRQKFTYKRTHPHHRVTIGLWSRARHPNYFGEIVVWWGIWLLCFGMTDLPWWSLVSPLFIMGLLLWVSGIPLLEYQHDKKYGSDPDYQAYKKSTRLLIPR